MRILIVEDNEDDARLMLRELAKDDASVEAARVESAAALEAALKDERWDIVLSDYALPGFDGVAALAMVKARWPELPFIMVSGTRGEETAVEVIKAGADDYLVKGRLWRLRSAVDRAVRDGEARRSHKALERENWERGRLLERLAETLPNIVYLQSLTERRLLLLTGAVERVLGYPSEEVMQWDTRQMMAITHPNEHALFRARVERFSPGRFGEVMESRFRLRRKDGSWAWLDNWETVFARDESGRPTQLLGTLLDVTRKKAAADALQDREATLRALLAAIPDRLLRLRGDGSLLEPLWAGSAPSEAAGARIESLFPAEVASELLSRVHGTRSAGPPEVYEFRADGEPGAGAPAQDRGARGARYHEARIVRSGPDEALVMVRDVTEKRSVEATLATTDRLVSVGTLAAGIAHEINNPLMFVSGNLEFLQRELSRADQGLSPELLVEMRSALGSAIEGADRVRQIVRDVKTFSRADLDERELCDVRRVLDSCARMAWSEIHHRARLRRDYREVPPVMANEPRLAQVFLNLLINAAQAIPESGAADQHEIVLTTRVNEAGRVVVEVRDSGGGIPASARARLFDPFFTTKPVGVGTGLGLSICQGIVLSLGGAITVESEVGKGSTFRVTLPAAEVPAPTLVLAPPPAAKKIARVAAGRRSRVLAIDDEPNLLEALRRLLRNHHDVTLSEGGEEALRRFRDGERYDVILCDVMMPGMNGMALHAALQRLAPDQASRVVFVSGGAFTSESAAFLDRVDNRRLDKPYTTAMLLEIIAAVTAAHSAAVSPAPASPP